MNIYVVIGSTGEYSDHNEWMVKAFKTEEAAQTHVKTLDDKTLELGVRYDADHPEYDQREKAQEIMKVLDPNFSCDYTGTRYEYCMVELVE